jgi:class 3 adenylate cyclase
MVRVRRVIVRRVRPNNTAIVSAANSRPSAMRLLDRDTVKKFNPSVLDLGDINAPCHEVEAIAAVFDLTGFTTFCNQVDSYLAIPRFLNEFLEWFFGNIRERITEREFGDRSELWAGLPIMSKFLGDGVLLIWDAQRMTEEQICRLAGTLYQICYAYKVLFYPRISMVVNKPPPILRCGVARGKVFSIGNDRDYVGHCINTASRLSHLGALTFCFPHRGFQVREHMPAEFRLTFIPKFVSIRGVGENELVWVVREEYEKLTAKNREQFRSLEPVDV